MADIPFTLQDLGGWNYERVKQDGTGNYKTKGTRNFRQIRI